MAGVRIGLTWIAMRRLGAAPLTGAEKQRRHRERIKARLAEAARLSARLGAGEANETMALYDSILTGLGATDDEREALAGAATGLQAEWRAFLAARAGDDLARLREDRRKRRSSLLARLDAMNGRGEG
jgi:hypothetical protein